MQQGQAEAGQLSVSQSLILLRCCAGLKIWRVLNQRTDQESLSALPGFASHVLVRERALGWPEQVGLDPLATWGQLVDRRQIEVAM